MTNQKGITKPSWRSRQTEGGHGVGGHVVGRGAELDAQLVVLLLESLQLLQAVLLLLLQGVHFMTQVPLNLQDGLALVQLGEEWTAEKDICTHISKNK